MTDLALITSNIEEVLHKLLVTAKLEVGNILVVGCSTSEINGKKIGSASNMAVAQAVMSGLLPLVEKTDYTLPCSVANI